MRRSIAVIALVGSTFALSACTTGRPTGPVSFSQNNGGNTAASDFLGLNMARRQTAKVIAMRQAAEQNTATAAVPDSQ